MRVLVAMIALGALGGCAFVEEKIPVNYVAPANLEVVDGASVVNVTVTGEDKRVSNRDRVGTKKNGYGVEAARIIASNNVVELVRGAVEQELESLGFKTGPGGLTINVELQTFYNEFQLQLFDLNAVAEVGFTVTALNPDGSYVYSRSYHAVGMNQHIFMATPSSAEVALEHALTAAMADVVQDESLQKSLLTAGRKLAEAPPLPSLAPSPAVASMNPPAPTAASVEPRPRQPAKNTPKPPLPRVVDFRPPAIGMRVYPDTGGYFEIASVDGTTVQTVNAALRQTTWVGLVFIPGTDSQMFDRSIAESIWPLEVGKTVTFNMSGMSTSGSDGAWQETVTVLRQEEIATEAGRFQTVVVETRERSLIGTFQSVTTRWYAPEVGFIVKYRHEVENGTGRPRAWTATRIFRPDAPSASTVVQEQ